MMQLMPVGIKGLVFAALVAAIVSSLSSMTNSVATIFTMDVYRSINSGLSQSQEVKVGRIVSLVSLIIAMICAKPLLGNFEQAFQYIQEFTGFFTPGIVAIFFLGIFWKSATPLAALVAAIGSAVFSLGFKLLWPELPFIDRVGLVFVLCILIPVLVVSLQKSQPQANAVDLNDVDFSTSTNFNIASVGVVLVLCALYAVWW